MSGTHVLGRGVIVVVGLLVAAGLGVGTFWALPEFTPLSLLTVVLVLVGTVVGGIVASRMAGHLLADYNVAEVEVDDIITRDGRMGPLTFGGQGVSATDVVDRIERADADRNAKGLVVKLNTPGGQVVPSEDIRRATEDFDGPTVAYAEDMAASGGFWIASGADEIHARRGAIVGSIGVNGAQLGREELRDKIGLDYRRFVAGDYKDSASPWRDLEADEVTYIQGLVDKYYDQFVDTVVAGTGLDAEFVEDTEARLYLGAEAAEIGLVDFSGPREAMESHLAERMGVDEVSVEPFEPDRGLVERLGRGVRAVAQAFGAGLAGALLQNDGTRIRV